MRFRASAWPMSSSAFKRGDSIPLPAKKSVVFLMTSRTVSISAFVGCRTARRAEIVSGECGQLLLVVRLVQRGDHRIDVSFHDLRQAVERQSNAMISQPILRKVVRADPFAALPGSDLTAPRGRVI